MRELNLAEQAAILAEAADNRLVCAEDIIAWADASIVAAKQPDDWMIELSTLSPPHLDQLTSMLRSFAAASPPLPLERTIQIIVLAHDAGLMELPATLKRLFPPIIFDRPKGANLTPRDERMADVLVWWDCTDDLQVIDPGLKAQFLTVAREYLAEASDIVDFLASVRARSSPDSSS